MTNANTRKSQTQEKASDAIFAGWKKTILNRYLSRRLQQHY